FLILGELFDQLWGFPKLLHGSSGSDEPLGDGFGDHAAVQHFCKDRRRRIAEQLATSTALQQGFTSERSSTKEVDEDIGVDEYAVAVLQLSQSHIPALCLRPPSATSADRVL